MAIETAIKVRFCETDALGHISNISYFIYAEEARTDLFRELGFEMGSEDWKFILASTKCDFVSQAHFNQRLTVISDIGKIGNASFTVVHKIVDETGKLIANAEATIVHFNFTEQKSERLPDWMKKEMEKSRVNQVKEEV